MFRYLKGMVMLIKFNSDNEEFHERLLAATGLRTVTGAYRSAAVQYPGMKYRIRHLQRQLDELKQENMALRQTLIDAREAAILLAQKASISDAERVPSEPYLESEYVFKSWSTHMSPHFLLGELSNPVLEDDRAVQTLEFSNGGLLKASWNPDGTDMKVIELTKLSLSFIPGDEDFTFHVEIFPE